LINKVIIEAFTEIARQKNIDRTNLGTIIEELFTMLIKKKYGSDECECENFSVIANMERGEIEIYQEMVIVDNVVDPVTEISIQDASSEDENLQVGDPFISVIDPSQFGRRLINLAKQQLSQKIREIEKQSVYDEYTARVGEITVGYIHQIQRDQVFININKTELVMPKSEQMENDRYRRGQTIRGIIKSVEFTPKGPEIIVSRSDNQFLRRLLEMEVPEIEDEIIEVKAIARVPGDRSKVVVNSFDKRIDAVGACVGMRGSRIQAIVRELNSEKIDIINWSKQPEILITRALAPAKPIQLYLGEDRKYVMAIFEDEELPIAIGKNGQNIKLASEVTGFYIDAVKKSEHEGTKSKNIYLDEVRGISTAQLESLAKSDIHTDNEFLETDRDELLLLKGFGEKTIDKISTILSDLRNAASTEDEPKVLPSDLKESV